MGAGATECGNPFSQAITVHLLVLVSGKLKKDVETSCCRSKQVQAEVCSVGRRTHLVTTLSVARVSSHRFVQVFPSGR